MNLPIFQPSTMVSQDPLVRCRKSIIEDGEVIDEAEDYRRIRNPIPPPPALSDVVTSHQSRYKTVSNNYVPQQPTITGTNARVPAWATSTNTITNRKPKTFSNHHGSHTVYNQHFGGSSTSAGAPLSTRAVTVYNSHGQSLENFERNIIPPEPPHLTGFFESQPEMMYHASYDASYRPAQNSVIPHGVAASSLQDQASSSNVTQVDHGQQLSSSQRDSCRILPAPPPQSSYNRRYEPRPNQSSFTSSSLNQRPVSLLQDHSHTGYQYPPRPISSYCSAEPHPQTPTGTSCPPPPPQHQDIILEQNLNRFLNSTNPLQPSSGKSVVDDSSTQRQFRLPCSQSTSSTCRRPHQKPRSQSSLPPKLSLQYQSPSLGIKNQPLPPQEQPITPVSTFSGLSIPAINPLQHFCSCGSPECPLPPPNKQQQTNLSGKAPQIERMLKQSTYPDTILPSNTNNAQSTFTPPPPPPLYDSPAKYHTSGQRQLTPLSYHQPKSQNAVLTIPPPPPGPPPETSFFPHRNRRDVKRSRSSEQNDERKRQKVESYTAGFYCNPCGKGFSNQNKYKQHIDEEHLLCDHPECSYSAPLIYLEAHKLRHINGRNGTPLLDDPFETDLWVQSRRRNYPSKDNIGKKEEEKRRTKELGTLNTSDATTPRLTEYSAIERLLRSRFKTALGRSSLQRRLGQVSAFVPSLKSILKRQKTWKLNEFKKQQPDSRRRRGKYPLSSIEFTNQDLQKPFPICEHFLKFKSCKWTPCHYSHDIAAYRRWQIQRNLRGFDIPMRPPLLYQLLLPEIQKTESIVLQALRYCVEKNFFKSKIDSEAETELPNSAELPSILHQGIANEKSDIPTQQIPLNISLERDADEEIEILSDGNDEISNSNSNSSGIEEEIVHGDDCNSDGSSSSEQEFFQEVLTSSLNRRQDCSSGALIQHGNMKNRDKCGNAVNFKDRNQQKGVKATQRGKRERKQQNNFRGRPSQRGNSYMTLKYQMPP